MAETVIPFWDKLIWTGVNIVKDLEEQADLTGVTIEQFTLVNVNNTFLAINCCGTTKNGVRFMFTWEKDVYILLSLGEEDEEFVSALTKVVEYLPFCRYQPDRTGLITFEWNKISPEARFDDLEKKEVVSLQRLS